MVMHPLKMFWSKFSPVCWQFRWSNAPPASASKSAKSPTYQRLYKNFSMRRTVYSNGRYSFVCIIGNDWSSNAYLSILKIPQKLNKKHRWWNTNTVTELGLLNSTTESEFCAVNWSIQGIKLFLLPAAIMVLAFSDHYFIPCSQKIMPKKEQKIAKIPLKTCHPFCFPWG